jgi:predicted peroxiredoxin
MQILKSNHIKMRNFIFLIIVGMIMVSCNSNQQSNNEPAQEEQTTMNAEPVKDGVFIHITKGYDDPHRVLMPLKMAVIMSDDKDVLVYMDIDAVALAIKDAKDLSYEGFESFQTYLKKLNENKVGVYVCPTCLEVAGFKPEEIMEGVQLAQKDKFFNFTEGRIITLDY